MSNHFFCVAKQKHSAFYKTLVLTNICCTVLIVFFSNWYNYKDLLQEKLHVLQSFLGIKKFEKHNNLEDFAAFKNFIANAITVYL